jgi:hypothetical protein
MAITLSGSTMTWPDGSTQTVNGYVFVPGMLSGSKWVNFTSSRTNNVTYTNSTGYPLAVCIKYGNFSTNEFYVDGVLIMNPKHDGNGGFMVHAIVPNGLTYRAYSVNGISTWFELRN